MFPKRCGIAKAFLLDIIMYKVRFIHSYIENMYTKKNRRTINCKAQPNVFVNGAVEFRINGMRHAPKSVTVGITPVCWQLRSSGFLLSE